MAVILTEGEKTVSGGSAIEVTANKVINLLLREENNLLKIDGNNELYCDLQLEDGIATTDTLPVGVTTGRVLEADGWTKSGTMLCFKTTSGDYVTRIYGDDGKLYIDNGTGTFKQIYLKSEVDALFTQLRSELSTVAFSGEYDDLLHKPTLGTASGRDVGTEPGDVPEILQNGKLSTSILPTMALHAYTVQTKQDLTTLTEAVVGDLGFVQADNQTYILISDPYSDIDNWTEFTSVISVNGYTGQVLLDTNDIPVHGTTNMYVTSTEKSHWNAKLGSNDVATVAISGNYNDLNNKPSVDTAMSSSSTNAVQNKVIKAYVDTTAGSSAAAKVSDEAYGSGWNGVTGVAPSKNAVYDEVTIIEGDISTLQTDVSNIQGDITNVQGDITNIQGDITNMQGDISALETAVAGGISDAAFSSAWNGDTTHAPSKNAVYDVLGDVETLLANI